MKNILIIFFLFSLIGCTKPKTVLICGDHVCVNKAEAQQFFEENLTLEVKIYNHKKTKNYDLVKLNMDTTDKKKVNIEITEKTTEEIKILTKDEITKIKKKVKNKKNVKKNFDKKNDFKKKKIKKNQISTTDITTSSQRINNNVDVCTIIKKCDIEEISKYLIKIGKKKNFPDITLRE